VILRPKTADLRSSIHLEDIDGAEFEHVEALPSPAAKAFDLKDVARFSTQSCPGVPDTQSPSKPL
jgi:hypothetical protein